MGDAQTLLLVLVLLYLVECLIWVRRGAVLFTRGAGRRFRMRHPAQLLGNARGSLDLGWPLPPLGTVFFAQQWPVSLSPAFLLAYTADSRDSEDRHRHTGRLLRWEEIRSVSVDGCRVLVNDEVFCRAATAGLARSLGGQLQKLRGLKPEQRAQGIRQWLAGRLAEDQVRSRLGRWRRWDRWLRPVCHATFLLLFVLAPWWVVQHGLFHVGGMLAIGLWGLSLLTAVLFWRAHRTLYPEAREERWKRLFTMVLVPPAAARASDHLARPLLEDFHALAVAAALLSSESFRSWAKRLWLDLEFPLPPCGDHCSPEIIEAERWFRQAALAAMATFLEGHGLAPRTFSAPPRRLEPDLEAYCPRCSTQYRRRDGVCADCGGLKLAPLEVPCAA